MQMFSRLDTNSDGSLNFEEFSAMPRPENRPEGAVAPEALEQRFTRMDSDGNGLLSPDELQQGQRRGNGGGMRPQGQGDGQGRPERQGQGQGDMRQRMENMTPEQREQMRERMENMTPEQREQMRERMQQMTPEQRRQMMQRRQGEPATPAASGAPAHDHGE
jgi:Ca2+-binding EF-hand superfamily protein